MLLPSLTRLAVLLALCGWPALAFAQGTRPAEALSTEPARTEPARTEPPRPTYAPQGEAMSFRLAEGIGPRGATRWVSATGQIQPATAQAFAAFRKANAIDGLPLVLDSGGGRVLAAMALGRMVREARMTTSIGRTISLGDRDAVRTSDVRCASACVLVLMGGASRSVAEDARVEVHMFSVELDADGNKARAEPSFRDIEQTQRMMARHAVYLAEMGIGARYLEIMTEASFRGATRRMTREEIVGTQLASVAPAEATPAAVRSWSISLPSAPPQLLRGARLTETERMAVDHELILECDGVRNFYWVTYRQQLTRLTGPRGPQPVTVQTARLVTDGWDYIFRAPQRGLGINTQGGDLWMRRSVPRQVFADAVAKGRLDVEIRAQGRPTVTASLYDPSLGRLLPELARRCDARPGLVTVGPHPRR